MTKISTRKRGIANRAEFEAKVDEIAGLDVELRQLTAEMDAKLQAVRELYSDRIASMETYRDSLFHACDSYASKHQHEVLLPGLRSGETSLARFGFRTGNPTLTLLTRSHSWAGVLDAIRTKGQEWVERFITQPAPKPNKEAMKDQLSAEELAGIGCRITQTEAFWLEPKDDSTPAT